MQTVEALSTETLRDGRVVLLQASGPLGGLFSLHLRLEQDAAGQFVGYQAWLRRAGEVFLFEDDALAAAQQTIRALASGGLCHAQPTPSVSQ